MADRSKGFLFLSADLSRPAEVQTHDFQNLSRCRVIGRNPSLRLIAGLLTLHLGAERFANVSGLDALKRFCARTLTATRGGPARPRDILIVDVGAPLGSLVGRTEQNVLQALRIAGAMVPCILRVDYVEKAVGGGVTSGGKGGNGDSGVSARRFGTLLTWLSDHASDVFVVCTSSDVSRLPPEFSRAERLAGPAWASGRRGEAEPVERRPPAAVPRRPRVVTGGGWPAATRPSRCQRPVYPWGRGPARDAITMMARLPGGTVRCHRGRS